MKAAIFEGLGWVHLWGWRDHFLWWDKHVRTWGFKALSFNRLLHTSPPQVTGAHSLPINALTSRANILQSWDLNFRCYSVNLIMRALVWFSATRTLERRSSPRAHLVNVRLSLPIWSWSVLSLSPLWSLAVPWDVRSWLIYILEFILFPFSNYAGMLGALNNHPHFLYFSTNCQKLSLQGYQISCLSQLMNRDNQTHLSPLVCKK